MTPPLPLHTLPAAVILAGGQGTRLRPVVRYVPKPMAAVGGKPFLEHLVVWLHGQGVRRVYLLTHYLGHLIERHFSTGEAWGLDIRCIREETPLGTGGAVAAALAAGAWDTPFLLLNGDSFIDVDLSGFVRAMAGHSAGMVLARCDDPSPYGAVSVAADGRILAFSEKRRAPGPGLINAGVYYLDPDLLKPWRGVRASLERDVFPALIASGRPVMGHICDGFFIDIGTPDNYRRFQNRLSENRHP